MTKAMTSSGLGNDPETQMNLVIKHGIIHKISLITNTLCSRSHTLALFLLLLFFYQHTLALFN